jgi:GT2 family glycosyltransferase
MSSNRTLWPVEGYDDAPLRKRLAYFRPWIEDRRVRFVGACTTSESYARALAAECVADGPADLVFAPGVGEDDLRRAAETAEELGCAFVGWSSDNPELAGFSRLWQSESWPFEIGADASDVAVWFRQGTQEAIAHPSIGIAVPTHAHPKAALEAIAAYAAEYPGTTRFALVANGVDEEKLDEVRRAIETAPQIRLIEFETNRGYGQGCNAGLMELLNDDSLEYLAVSNDDVLPGTDCLYELAHSMRELAKLGHKPGAAGPVSNEINGAQRVEVGAIRSAAEMRNLAAGHWQSHRSSATQAIQIRGLLLLWSRECLELVGGFDPRFGIGNFEDDDHNLRTRLAGFTLWIVPGAFLFHHGSSTFKALKVDYKANIRRNAEAMMRKWSLERLEDWVSLETAPAGLSLFQPFGAEPDEPGLTVRINGESVDLVHQASDVEFAAWIIGQEPVRTPNGRRAVIELLTGSQSAA